MYVTPPCKKIIECEEDEKREACNNQISDLTSYSTINTSRLATGPHTCHVP